jgi:hypothetical protein
MRVAGLHERGGFVDQNTIIKSVRGHMNKCSSTVRYYLLVGAYGMSIGLLLISVFVLVEYLSPGRRVPGNPYSAWIFGFGIGGLVLLICTMIADAQWSQSNLVIRPDMPFDRHKLLIVSIGSGIFLVASLLMGIFRVGFSVGTFGLLIFVPFTIILWLFLAVRCALGYRDGAKDARLPLLVTTIFICLAALVYWTNSRIEFGFRWRLSRYEKVVRLVERGELRPDSGGYTMLPEDYQWLSDGGEIVVIRRGDLTSVIFFTQLGFPGEYRAIAYRSDDSVPENYNDDRCDGGWRVQADIPKWFVCISD